MYTDAIVTRHVRELFNRLPTLAFFRLRTDLIVADVSVNSSPGCTGSRSLYPRVMQAIVELAETHPEAMQLMRGRTFARIFVEQFVRLRRNCDGFLTTRPIPAPTLESTAIPEGEVMLSGDPKFPARRTYIVKFRSDATPDSLCGRVENLVTCKQTSSHRVTSWRPDRARHRVQ